MPPKKKKAKKATARQKQSQTVIVNVGGKSKSGRGKLPPPSYQNNLTRIQPQQQQIDYTPLLLSMMQQQSKVPIQTNTQPPVNNIVPPINNIVPPILPSAPPSEAASASNFQPMPSQADERLAQTVQRQADDDVRSGFKAKQFRGRSEPPPTAVARPRRGPIPKDLQVAEPYFEPGGGGGGAPIVTPSSVRPTLAMAEAVGELETKPTKTKISKGQKKKQYEEALKAAASSRSMEEFIKRGT